MGFFLSRKYGVVGIQKFVIFRRFQKYELTLAQKCTEKKLFNKNKIYLLKNDKSSKFCFFLEITFLGAFLH